MEACLRDLILLLTAWVRVSHTGHQAQEGGLPSLIDQGGSSQAVFRYMEAKRATVKTLVWTETVTL